MMKKIFLFLTVTLALFVQNRALAGGFPENWELKARFGYNIGATAPIGLPATIRSIDAYRLTPSFLFGVEALAPFWGKWGLTTGLHLENKGMDGDVTTKMYYMEVKKGESQLAGRYTGSVHQVVREWMVTLPILATWQVSNVVRLKGGPYFSLLVDKDFSGYVFDGYLRQNDPTGPKVEIGHEENERATYDFTDNMRNFQMGLDVGADFRLHPAFGVSVDLNWGLTGLFESDFKTVEQTLYPIYGTVSLYYNIR